MPSPPGALARAADVRLGAVADEAALEALELPRRQARVEEVRPRAPSLVEPGEHGLHASPRASTPIGLASRARRRLVPGDPGIEETAEIGVTRGVVGCDLVRVNTDGTRGGAPSRFRFGPSPRSSGSGRRDHPARPRRPPPRRRLSAACPRARRCTRTRTRRRCHRSRAGGPRTPALRRGRDHRRARPRSTSTSACASCSPGRLVGEAKIDDAPDPVVERCLPSGLASAAARCRLVRPHRAVCVHPEAVSSPPRSRTLKHPSQASERLYGAHSAPR